MTNIGDRVRTNDLSLPIGTVMDAEGTVWIKEVDGWHNSNGSRHYRHPNAVAIEGTVTGLVPYVETLAMHKQRFAVTCLAMGHHSGGGNYLEGAREILRRVSVDQPGDQALRIGSWVQSQVNLGIAPAGTVLLSGAPGRAEGHSLHVVNSAYSVGHLSGPRRSVDYLLLQVVGLPPIYETDDWPEPAENEEDLIRLFRISAWEAGFAEKQNRSWCSDFEAAISVLSLSANEARRLEMVGELHPVATTTGPIAGAVVIDREELDAAPVGTVIDEGTNGWHATKRADGYWDTVGSGGTHDVRATSGITVHLGLRYRSVPPVGPRFATGTPVTTPEQNSCVEGAVFAYTDHDRPHRRYLWARGPGGQHPTVGLTLGETVTSRCNVDTVVLWDGISPIHEVPVSDHAELAVMPIGTIIGQAWGGREFSITWEKTDRNQWRPSTGGSSPVSDTTLAVSPLRYAYIPVPNVPRPATAPSTSIASVVDDVF